MRRGRRTALSLAGTACIQRRQAMSDLLQLEHAADRGCEPAPFGSLLPQVPPSGLCERIELRASSKVARSPLGFDPSCEFELVQCGIERAVGDLQLVVGDLCEALADRPAMERLEGEDLQQQEVESALNEVWRFAHSLGYRDFDGSNPQTVGCRSRAGSAGLKTRLYATWRRLDERFVALAVFRCLAAARACLAAPFPFLPAPVLRFPREASRL